MFCAETMQVEKLGEGQEKGRVHGCSEQGDKWEWRTLGRWLAPSRGRIWEGGCGLHTRCNGNP